MGKDTDLEKQKELSVSDVVRLSEREWLMEQARKERETVAESYRRNWSE